MLTGTKRKVKSIKRQDRLSGELAEQGSTRPWLPITFWIIEYYEARWNIVKNRQWSQVEGACT